MAGLKRYVVNVQGRRNVTETILKLTPEEAERLGGVEYVKQAAPANKGRSAANKGRAPANKGRSAERAAEAAPAAVEASE